MRSGEWLRTQWIARVAYGLGDGPWQPDVGVRVSRLLKALEDEGVVERRRADEFRNGEIGGVPVSFPIPRSEWRLTPSAT